MHEIMAPRKQSTWTTRRRINAKYEELKEKALRKARSTTSPCSPRSHAGIDRSAVVDEFNFQSLPSASVSVYQSDSPSPFPNADRQDSDCESHSEHQNEHYDSDDEEYEPYGLGCEGSRDEQDDIPLQLALWATRFKICPSALRALLAILVFLIPELPKDPRTLLHTGSVSGAGIKTIGGGEYCYLGIKKYLNSMLDVISHLRESAINAPIKLQFNIDGLPLFKSTNGSFWSILGKVLHSDAPKPFVVALFYGDKKPTSLEEYLNDFIEEILDLTENGFEHLGKKYRVILSSILCDAPARAFIKNIKLHSGYSACEKCITEGDYMDGRVCFPELDAALRTDRSFESMVDEEHHHGPTPLTRLPIGLVTEVPIDYMHLVCLGVVKKLIKQWRECPWKDSRLTSLQYERISALHESLCSSIPREFARSPRSLFEHPRWKATEFRTFLLYTGPVSLYGNVPEDIFNNFLLLSCGIHLLINPKLVQSHNATACELLVKFVKLYAQLFGEGRVVFNVHGLIHLSDDTKLHGPLDDFSSSIRLFLMKIICIK